VRGAHGAQLPVSVERQCGHCSWRVELHERVQLIAGVELDDGARGAGGEWFVALPHKVRLDLWRHADQVDLVCVDRGGSEVSWLVVDVHDEHLSRGAGNHKHLSLWAQVELLDS